jgi:hypothetical protein
MSRLRILLMCNGDTEHDFKMEMELPKIGELITHGGNHYEVRFIQYVISKFRKSHSLDYILITATRETYESKRVDSGPK